jgi:hypothetical protein
MISAACDELESRSFLAEWHSAAIDDSSTLVGVSASAPAPRAMRWRAALLPGFR